MGPLKSFAKEAGFVAAATLGAGIFALPYMFLRAGWGTGLFYLFIFSVIVISAHTLYFRVLEKTGTGNGLLGLVRGYFGKFWFIVGLLAILGGLVLALVVYLILGGQLVRMLFPSLPPTAAIISFWTVAALPFFIKERRSINLEAAGLILMVAIIFFVFLTADVSGALSKISVFDWRNAFLPFGAILFALAGWTAVEPVFEEERASRSELTPRAQPYFALTAGTAIAALLYLMFVAGIFGSPGIITPDTLSGLVGWPGYKIALIAVMGLFALWTSYLPIGLEIGHSLENDLRLPRKFALASVLALPPFLLFLGLNSFASVVGLAGGVFLGLQHIFIISLGKKVLEIRGVKGFLLNLVSFVFVLAAVYEIYYFVVK